MSATTPAKSMRTGKAAMYAPAMESCRTTSRCTGSPGLAPARVGPMAWRQARYGCAQGGGGGGGGAGGGGRGGGGGGGGGGLAAGPYQGWFDDCPGRLPWIAAEIPWIAAEMP